jgi:hypothetical protein
MRIWKLVVLLAGVVGAIGFFSPLVDYHSADGKLTSDASAFEIARGVEGGSDVEAQAERLGLSRADAERLARAFDAGLEAYAGAVVACFIPAGALVALGLLLMLRDRMGRLGGLCAIALGVSAIAVFARFWQADQSSRDAAAALGLGVYLLLAAGLGGTLAGLGALVSPDRGS